MGPRPRVGLRRRRRIHHRRTGRWALVCTATSRCPTELVVVSRPLRPAGLHRHVAAPCRPWRAPTTATCSATTTRSTTPTASRTRWCCGRCSSPSFMIDDSPRRPGAGRVVHRLGRHLQRIEQDRHRCRLPRRPPYRRARRRSHLARQRRVRRTSSAATTRWSPTTRCTSCPTGAAVYVDIAGDSAVTRGVHQHFGDSLRTA